MYFNQTFIYIHSAKRSDLNESTNEANTVISRTLLTRNGEENTTSKERLVTDANRHFSPVCTYPQRIRRYVTFFTLFMQFQSLNLLESINPNYFVYKVYGNLDD